MIHRALLAVMLGAPALSAQRSELSLDAGLTRIRFADSLDASALSLSPALRAASRRASISASGTISMIEQSTSTSGQLAASVVPVMRGRFSAALEATAGGSSHSDGTNTGQLLGSGRLHLDGPSRGAWIGAGAGGASADVWRPIVQADAGAWLATGPVTLSGGVLPTRVDDTLRYTDAWLAFRRDAAPLELTASLGARAGSNLPALPADDNVWGSVTATYSLSPRLALVAGAGTYPVDLTQGYPGGGYFTVSMRLRSARGAVPAVVAEPVAPVRRFDVTRLPGGAARIRVVASAASRIEIAGDFTAWEPVALTQANGVWTIDLRIPSGSHQVSIRADGGAWIAPPGLVEVRDEFGGRAGVLHVP